MLNSIPVTSLRKVVIQYCETNRRKFKFKCGICITNFVVRDIVKLKLSTVFPQKLFCHQREKFSINKARGLQNQTLEIYFPKKPWILAKISQNRICMPNLMKSITIIIIKKFPLRATQVTTDITINYLIGTIKRLIIIAVIRKLDEPFNNISKD